MGIWRDWWKGDDQWKLFWALAWPQAMSDSSLVISQIVDTACIGHIVGVDAMAAASIAQAFMSLTQIFALSTANCLNTLCPQALGSGNKKLAGVWLQAGIVCFSFAIVPVFFIWWFSTEKALRAMGMADDVSHMALRFAKYSIPAYYFQGIRYCCEQYFASIHIAKPAMIANLFFTAANLGFNILFMSGIPGTSWDGLGYIGSPISNAVCQSLQVTAYLTYCCYVKQYHKDYWPDTPVHKNLTLARMKEYAKLSVPMALGMLLEEGQWQLLMVFTAHLGSADVSAWACVGILWQILSSASFGFCKAVNIRVAHLLGSGELKDTFRTIAYGMISVGLFSVLSGVSVYSFRDYVGKIYTTDDKVISSIKGMCWLMAVSLLPLNLGAVGLFVLDAQGRPSVSAAIIALGTWGLNVPLAAVFIYKYDLGPKGPLLAAISGYGASMTACSVLLYFSNWEKYIRQARERSEILRKEKEKEEQAAKDIESGSSSDEDQIDESRPLIQ